MDKYEGMCDRELMVKLIGLIEDHNKMTDEKEKRRATRKKKPTKAEMSGPIEDPIKSDITKMLEKPKKRRKPKEEEEEHGEIDDRIENLVPEPPREQPTPQQQSFLQQEQPAIKTTITEKPVKERPTPAKLFKDDLLMSIDPSERIRAIENTKTALLEQTAQPIKEEQAKRNISNFLTTYSKNKKY